MAFLRRLIEVRQRPFLSGKTRSLIRGGSECDIGEALATRRSLIQRR